MAMQQEQTVLTSQSVQAMHRTAEVMDEYRKRLKLCSEPRGFIFGFHVFQHVLLE